MKALFSFIFIAAFAAAVNGQSGNPLAPNPAWVSSTGMTVAVADSSLASGRVDMLVHRDQGCEWVGAPTTHLYALQGKEWTELVTGRPTSAGAHVLVAELQQGCDGRAWRQGLLLGFDFSDLNTTAGSPGLEFFELMSKLQPGVAQWVTPKDPRQQTGAVLQWPASAKNGENYTYALFQKRGGEYFSVATRGEVGQFGSCKGTVTTSFPRGKVLASSAVLVVMKDNRTGLAVQGTATIPFAPPVNIGFGGCN